MVYFYQNSGTIDLGYNCLKAAKMIILGVRLYQMINQ